MFIGHYGVALAAKKWVPRASLGSLCLAALWVDLIWPIFLWIGIEKARPSTHMPRIMQVDLYRYPYSHSLLAGCLWGLGLAIGNYSLKRDRKIASVLAALVVSHWFLDAVVHRSDLPLGFTGMWRLGLGLWEYPWATAVIEGALFAFGVSLYLRAKPKKGSRVVTFSVVLISAFSIQFLGLTPPNLESIIAVGFAQWLLVALAFWTELGSEKPNAI